MQNTPRMGRVFSFRSLIRPFISIVVQAAPPKTMKKKRSCGLITKIKYNQYKANSTNQEQLLASHASNAKAIVFRIINRTRSDVGAI